MGPRFALRVHGPRTTDSLRGPHTDGGQWWTGSLTVHAQGDPPGTQDDGAPRTTGRGVGGRGSGGGSEVGRRQVGLR